MNLSAGINKVLTRMLARPKNDLVAAHDLRNTAKS